MISALPFYASRAEQWGRQWYTEGLPAYRLLTPPNQVLPFVHTREPKGPVFCFRIWKVDPETAAGDTVYFSFASANYKQYLIDGMEYIFHYGEAAVDGLQMDCGYYYLEIDGKYSEWFYVPVQWQPNRYTKLRWTHSGDMPSPARLEHQIYQTHFVNLLWLDEFCHQADYVNEQEGFQNAYGQFIATLRNHVKIWCLPVYQVPEWLADCLALLPNHDQVQVGRMVGVKQVEVANPNWKTRLLLGDMEIKFRTEEVITAGCGEPMPVQLIGENVILQICDPAQQSTSTSTTTSSSSSSSTSSTTAAPQVIYINLSGQDRPCTVRSRVSKEAGPAVTVTVLFTAKRNGIQYWAREFYEVFAENLSASDILYQDIAPDFAENDDTWTLVITAVSNPAYQVNNGFASGTITGCVTTYTSAGQITSSYATQEEACADANATIPIYTANGTAGTGTRVYLDETGSTLAPQGWCKRSTGITLLIDEQGFITQTKTCTA